jgi:hypothetical protein
MALAGTLCCVIAANPCDLRRAGFGYLALLLWMLVTSVGLALAGTLCCWLLLKMRVSSLVNALAGTIDYDIACCLLCVVLLSMFD